MTPTNRANYVTGVLVGERNERLRVQESNMLEIMTTLSAGGMLSENKESCVVSKVDTYVQQSDKPELSAFFARLIGSYLWVQHRLNEGIKQHTQLEDTCRIHSEACAEWIQKYESIELQFRKYATENDHSKKKLYRMQRQSHLSWCAVALACIVTQTVELLTGHIFSFSIAWCVVFLSYHVAQNVTLASTEQRIERFYNKWNPSKLKDKTFLSSTVQKHGGHVEELFISLEKRYGPESMTPQYVIMGTVSLSLVFCVALYFRLYSTNIENTCNATM